MTVTDRHHVCLHAATNAYVGTEVLAFICCGFHLVMAATLINNRKAFGHAQREPNSCLQLDSDSSCVCTCTVPVLACLPAM